MVLTTENQAEFYEAVWAWVMQVPHGRVVTYGQIAKALDVPNEVNLETYKAYGARWVGEAMAASPEKVPWQRVINAQGKISDRPGAKRQRMLLEEEGVEFFNDKIDLKRFQWRGPGHVDAPIQGRLF